MSELGKCSIRGCDRGASVVYPLLAGSPAFCGGHRNPGHAEGFGGDFDPNDFGPPIEDEFLEFREPILTRCKFAWTDREGNEHKLQDIDDRYLVNIINFLVKKDSDEFEATIRFLEKEAKRRLKLKGGA